MKKLSKYLNESLILVGTGSLNESEISKLIKQLERGADNWFLMNQKSYIYKSILGKRNECGVLLHALKEYEELFTKHSKHDIIDKNTLITMNNALSSLVNARIWNENLSRIINLDTKGIDAMSNALNKVMKYIKAPIDTHEIHIQTIGGRLTTIFDKYTDLLTQDMVDDMRKLINDRNITVMWEDALVLTTK